MKKLTSPQTLHQEEPPPPADAAVTDRIAAARQWLGENGGPLATKGIAAGKVVFRTLRNVRREIVNGCGDVGHELGGTKGRRVGQVAAAGGLWLLCKGMLPLDQAGLDHGIEDDINQA